MGGSGTSPPVSAGVAHATPELTKNATAAPESATTTALEGRNRVFNLALPTGLG